MLVHVHPYVPCSKSSLFTVNITMFIHVHGQKPSSFPFSMLKNATFRHKRKHHCHPLQGKKTPSSPCSMFKITTFHRRITVVILPKNHLNLPYLKPSLLTANITMFIHVHGQNPPSSPCSVLKVKTPLFNVRITIVILFMAKNTVFPPISWRSECSAAPVPQPPPTPEEGTLTAAPPTRPATRRDFLWKVAYLLVNYL